MKRVVERYDQLVAQVGDEKLRAQFVALRSSIERDWLEWYWFCEGLDLDKKLLAHVCGVSTKWIRNHERRLGIPPAKRGLKRISK